LEPWRRQVGRLGQKRDDDKQCSAGCPRET
jgi:hypothetical protein